MNVALVGYGKMGHEIEKLLLEHGDHVGLILDLSNPEDFKSENFKGIDVAIEFTTPAQAYPNLHRLLEWGVPVVCGTTGWLDRYAEIVALCRQRNGAFFYASNYSIGMNLFFKINRELAHLMNRFGQYDVTVEEVHHTQKKDAPSGTAITLAEEILAETDRKQTWVCGTTTVPDELEITSVRRSVVPGTHIITWESAADSLTLTHMAKGRAGLAEGAILAARFLCDKRGIFSMEDLLKIK